MSDNEVPRCKHCGEPMKKWANPAFGTWHGEYQWVCFNDECDYYRRGWAWMEDQYNVTASYRWKIDPTTGEKGPLPVWSPQALKGDILWDEE